MFGRHDLKSLWEEGLKKTPTRNLARKSTVKINVVFLHSKSQNAIITFTVCFNYIYITCAIDYMAFIMSFNLDV